MLYHQKHMGMTLLASFFYSAHLPERLAPGRFDYIGECGRAGVGVTVPAVCVATWQGDLERE
jgi:hypothetical protein